MVITKLPTHITDLSLWKGSFEQLLFDQKMLEISDLLYYTEKLENCQIMNSLTEDQQKTLDAYKRYIMENT